MLRYLVFLVLGILLVVNCSNSPTTSPTNSQNEDIILTLNKFTFANTTNDSIAIVFDGNYNNNFVNDSTLTTESGEIVIENINNSTINNELIAFTSNRRPMIIENFDWESDSDTVLTFEDYVTIPLKGWVIYVGNTSFEYQQERIQRGMEDCNRIFAHEGTGIQFELELVDVSTLPNIEQFYDISTTGDMRDVSQFLSADPNKLNIYFTKTVAGDPHRAYTTFRAIQFDIDNNIAHGMYTVDGGLLAHEIGHTLTLLHYDAGRIGSLNVEADIGTQIRVYFTEGQLYQMWFNDSTALNTIYNIPIQSRIRNSIYSPDHYLDAWGESQLPPYFELYFDNDVIQ
jgi:hypothetical protein